MSFFYKSCLFLFLGAFAAPIQAEFSVNGRWIQWDGERIFLRGVCYQPTPVGENPSQAPPYGDYFTANYKALYERDILLMREMGCNLIRVYGWTPGADHSDFLNLCYNSGDRPILVLINRWINPATNWSDSAAVTQIENDYLAMVPEANQSPVVMGFLLGNETNISHGNGTNSAFWSAHNSIAGAIKSAAPDKLVSMPITDAISSVSAYELSMGNLDFWSMQIYRGESMGSLFSQFRSASNKPLLITEFGMDAYDARVGGEFANNANYPATVVGNLWNEILANIDVCAGAAVFEWTDEWWKSSGQANVQNNGGFTNHAFVDQQMNEEWWGIFRIADNGSQPDVLTPRALFDVLQDKWKLPEITLSISRPSGVPVVRFPSGRSDLSFNLSASIDQSGWTTIAVSDNSGSIVAVPGESLAVNITGGVVEIADQYAGAKRYYRLEVERIGP